MNADVVVQLLFWLAATAFIAGFVYLMHRLTAPAAKRMNLSLQRRYYEQMAARGHAVSVPRTWQSGGLAGHDWNTDPAFRQIISRAGLAILAAFALGVALRGATISMVQVLGEALLGFVVVSGVFFGVRFYERRRVQRGLEAAGDRAPRGAFKVVANAHGLFVPLADRVVEGAWDDWSVVDAEIDIDKYGEGICHAITLAHRDNPGEKIPVIASTFENGDELMDVIAARVARVD